MDGLTRADLRDGDLRRFSVLFPHAERMHHNAHIATFQCGWLSGKRVLVQEPIDAVGGQLLSSKLRMHGLLKHEAIVNWSEVRGWTVADYEELPTLTAYLAGSPEEPARIELLKQFVNVVSHMVEKGVYPTDWDKAFVQVDRMGKLHIMELGGCYFESDKLAKEECDRVAQSVHAQLCEILPQWREHEEAKGIVQGEWLKQYREFRGQDGVNAINGGNLYRRLWAGSGEGVRVLRREARAP